MDCTTETLEKRELETLKHVLKYIEGVIEKLEAKEKKEEVTYSVGDRFASTLNNKKYLLSRQGLCNVSLTCLKDGALWGSLVVGDIKCISQQEFNAIAGHYPFTRYWDNRKKEYCPDKWIPKAKKEPEKPKVTKATEPELRHGDYGYNKSNDNFFLYVKRKEQIELFGEVKGSGCPIDVPFSDHIKLGNIFADLKRNSEDLREFEVSGQYNKEKHMAFSAQLRASDPSLVHINTSDSFFNLNQAIKIHQNLGQLIATDIRRQQK